MFQVIFLWYIVKQEVPGAALVDLSLVPISHQKSAIINGSPMDVAATVNKGVANCALSFNIHSPKT